MSETNEHEHESDALEEAIAENPEAVAAFVDQLDLVNELLAALDLATSALDDDMVVSLASTGSALGEVADVAADPETVAALRTVLSAVGEVDVTDGSAEPVGALGLVRALGDPDVQAGLGFLVAVARELGTELRDGES